MSTIKTYYMELGVIERGFVNYMLLAVMTLETSRVFEMGGRANTPLPPIYILILKSGGQVLFLTSPKNCPGPMRNHIGSVMSEILLLQINSNTHRDRCKSCKS